MEPDFNQMLDPSVIIDPPSNTWQSNDRHTSQTRMSRRDQPKTKHKAKKRRRHRSSSSSSTSRTSSLSSHRKSKRSKSPNTLIRRRSTSSFPSSNQSMNDYGRYKKTRQSPQVADILSTLQPVRTTDETPNIHSDNVVQQTSRDTGSKSEAEIWSFHKAINEVFRLLPQELCPRPLEKHTPAKPLSGIVQLMESHATPLLAHLSTKCSW